MKNKNFLFLQYNKIDWQIQEKTKINSKIDEFIIDSILSKKKGSSIKIFDIGFGIGFFMKLVLHKLKNSYERIIIHGCEPSEKNYEYFTKKPLQIGKGIEVKTFDNPFLKTKTNENFDFVTAVYVFPHFISDDLDKTAEKIKSMLEPKGKFILVVANEDYLERKLKSRPDLLVKKETIKFNNKKYQQIWHYSEIPQAGKVLNCDRETSLYSNLFEKSGFELILKQNLNHNNHICTVFVFQKK